MNFYSKNVVFTLTDDAMLQFTHLSKAGMTTDGQNDQCYGWLRSRLCQDPSHADNLALFVVGVRILHYPIDPEDPDALVLEYAIAGDGGVIPKAAVDPNDYGYYSKRRVTSGTTADSNNTAGKTGRVHGRAAKI